MLIRWAHDPWIFFNGNAGDETMEIDRRRVVGIFIPCLNNEDIILTAITTLIEGMPVHYPFGVLFLDGGSTDGTVKVIQDNCPFPVFGPHSPKEVFPHDIQQPCKGEMNVAVDMWMGLYNKETNRWAMDDRVGYIGFFHTDGRYNRQPGWLGKLVDICEADPEIGCLGPWHHNTEPSAEHEYNWNPPMFVVPVHTMRESYKRYGWWIDPGYWSGTSYCDWDMHRRFMGEMQMKTLLAPRSKVYHTGIGSRNALTAQDWWVAHDRENREYYANRWGTPDHPWK